MKKKSFFQDETAELNLSDEEMAEEGYVEKKKKPRKQRRRKNAEDTTASLNLEPVIEKPVIEEIRPAVEEATKIYEFKLDEVEVEKPDSLDFKEDPVLSDDKTLELETGVIKTLKETPVEPLEIKQEEPAEEPVIEETVEPAKEELVEEPVQETVEEVTKSEEEIEEEKPRKKSFFSIFTDVDFDEDYDEVIDDGSEELGDDDELLAGYKPKKASRKKEEEDEEPEDDEMLAGYKAERRSLFSKKKQTEDDGTTKVFSVVSDEAKPINFNRQEVEEEEEEDEDDEYEYITPHYTLNAIMLTLVFIIIGMAASFFLFKDGMREGIRQAYVEQGYVLTKGTIATAEDIMEGKTAYVNGKKITGTHIDVNTSTATATANDILDGYTAYVDGKKITGKIPTFPLAVFYIPTTKNQVIPKGYYIDMELIVQGDSDLVPKNIRKGVTIFGVKGTYE